MNRSSFRKIDFQIAAVLFLVMFMSGADMLIMTPILPQVTRELGVEISLGGLWVTAYSGATGVSALIFGPISDSRGRKPVLIAGTAVLGLGTAGCGIAQGFATMMIARILAGFGAGLLVTSTTSFVGDHFDGKQRAVVMGYVMGGFFLSLILGVPIGAALTGAFGWSLMFKLFGAFIGVVLVAVILGLTNPRHEHRSSVGLGRALARYPELLRSPPVLGVLLMSLSIGISMTMFSVYSSPWMEDCFGLDTTERGLVYAVGGPAVLVGGPLAGRLSNRLGRVKLVLIGSALMAGMQMLIAYTDVLGFWIGTEVEKMGLEMAKLGTVPWAVTVPPIFCFFLIMIAGSSRSAPFQTFALEVVAPDRRGTLAAIRNGFNQVGRAVGAAIGALLWSWGGSDSYRTICLVAAVTGAIGALTLWGLAGMDRPVE